MERDGRVVRARLDREVAVADRGLDLVARERAASATSAAGFRAAMPNGSPGAVEQRRAEAERERERRRAEADRLAGVVGRRVAGRRCRVPIGCPSTMRRDARVQSFEQLHEIVAVVGDRRRTRRTAAGPATGVTMPGLVLALERDDGRGVARNGRRRRSAPQRRPRRRATTVAAASAPAPCRAEERRRRLTELATLTTPTTCFATFESGSASASIACDSALVSAVGERRCTPRTWCPSCTAASAASTAANLASTLGGQRGSFVSEDRLHRVERRLRALHVGLEVDEVGARVALLLTRDLRRRHLVEQLDRAVGDRSGLQLDVLHQVLRASRRSRSAPRCTSVRPSVVPSTQSFCSM